MFSLHALLDALPYLIKAAQATVLISLVGLAAGFIIAIAVCSARLSKNSAIWSSDLGPAGWLAGRSAGRADWDTAG